MNVQPRMWAGVFTNRWLPRRVVDTDLVKAVQRAEQDPRDGAGGDGRRARGGEARDRLAALRTEAGGRDFGWERLHGERRLDPPRTATNTVTDALPFAIFLVFVGALIVGIGAVALHGFRLLLSWIT